MIKGKINKLKSTLTFYNKAEKVKIEVPEKIISIIGESLENNNSKKLGRTIKKLIAILGLTTIFAVPSIANSNLGTDLHSLGTVIQQTEMPQNQIENLKNMGNKIIKSIKIDNDNPEIDRVLNGDLKVNYINDKNEPVDPEIKKLLNTGIEKIVLKDLENSAKIGGYQIFDDSGMLTKEAKKSMIEFLNHFKINIYPMDHNENDRLPSFKKKGTDTFLGYGGYCTTTNGVDGEVVLRIPGLNNPDFIKDLKKHNLLQSYIDIALVLTAHESGHGSKLFISKLVQFSKTGTFPEPLKITDENIGKVLAPENIDVLLQDNSIKDFDLSLKQTEEILKLLKKHGEINEKLENSLDHLGSNKQGNMRTLDIFTTNFNSNIQNSYIDDIKTNFKGLTTNEVFYLKHAFKIINSEMNKMNRKELLDKLDAIKFVSILGTNRSNLPTLGEYSFVSANFLNNPELLKYMLNPENSAPVGGFIDQKSNYVNNDKNIVNSETFMTYLYLFGDKLSPKMRESLVKLYLITYKDGLKTFVKKDLDNAGWFTKITGGDNIGEKTKLEKEIENKNINEEIPKILATYNKIIAGETNSNLTTNYQMGL